MEMATFSAGCFWGPEATFDQITGVTQTTVGYMGGEMKKPTYEDVCTGQTGHAEVVQMFYDPEIVDYGHLLDVFWNCHDPTQENRQGYDIGTQYRSAIFWHSAEQRDAAQALRETLEASGRFAVPIATLIEQARTYWIAEDYHQKYLARRTNRFTFG